MDEDKDEMRGMPLQALRREKKGRKKETNSRERDGMDKGRVVSSVDGSGKGKDGTVVNAMASRWSLVADSEQRGGVWDGKNACVSILFFAFVA